MKNQSSKNNFKMRKYGAGRNNFNLNNSPLNQTRLNACAMSRNTPGQNSFFFRMAIIFCR